MVNSRTPGGYDAPFSKRPQPLQTFGGDFGTQDHRLPRGLPESELRPSQRRAVSARRQRSSESPTTAATTGAFRDDNAIPRKQQALEPASFKNRQEYGARAGPYEDIQQQYRGARSTVRGGNAGGNRGYPYERPLQQVGIRDSRYYGGANGTQRGGDPRTYREGNRKAAMNGASSESRRIVYQAKDMATLVKGKFPKAQASEPVPIKLDDDNKEKNGVPH